MSKVRLSSSLILFILIFAFPVSAYDYSGVIYENGDDRWDSNEIDFIEFELDKGETFELSFSSVGVLEVMVCDCDSYSDIEDFLYELANDGTVPNDLYLWLDSYYYTSGSFIADSRMDVTVAIFTYDSSNPSSMSYTLSSNIPKGDRYGPSIDGLSVIIFIVIIVGAIYFLRKRNKPKVDPYSPYQTQQAAGPYQSTAPFQETATYQDTSMGEHQSVMYCPNCGSQNTSTFCTECGTRIN